MLRSNETLTIPSELRAKHNTGAISYEFLPWGLILFFLCFFGLIGNILSALVLLRPKMRSTYSVLTLGLTFCDAVHFFTKFFRYGIQSMFLHFGVAKGYTHIFFPMIGPSARAINFTAYTAALYMTVAVAIDRYLAVCRPHLARTVCTRRRALWTILLVILFSGVYNLPRWWEYKTEIYYTVSRENDSQSMSTYYKMSRQPLCDNVAYKIYYKCVIYFFIMYCIPFISLFTFNFLIWRVISVSTEQRRQWTSHQKDENSFAITLLAVVGVFLICISIFPILDIISIAGYEYNPVFDRIASVMLTLNSSINFILYCLFGRRFREEFVAFWWEITSGKRGLMRTKSDITGMSTRSITTGTLKRNLSRDDIGRHNSVI